MVAPAGMAAGDGIADFMHRGHWDGGFGKETGVVVGWTWAGVGAVCASVLLRSAARIRGGG